MHEVMTCPLCRHDQFQALQGYDRKVGPEIFEFIKSPYKLSQWALCRRCGFCFQNPRPSPDDVENIYSSGLYRAKREYGEYYFQTRYTRPFEHFRWLSQYATWEAPPRILDIGAGYGGAVRAFQDLGARAEGIEIDAALCAAAPERFEVTLINGDFLTYPFEEGAYDVVYSAHTHEHFDDFVTVNKRIHSLLKPDGHLLLILPTFRFAGFNGQGFINVFHNSMFTGRSLWNMLVLGSFQPITICYPFRHSQAEVWGLGRRAPSVDLRLRHDRAWLVKQEVRLAPALFERLYRMSIGRWMLMALIARVWGCRPPNSRRFHL